MDRPSDSSVTNRARTGAPAAKGSRWMLPRWPVLVGVIGLGAVATTGSWFKRQADARQQAEVHAIQAEVAGLKKQTAQYQERMVNLRWNAAKMRARADATGTEPLKSWARERAKIFEDMVALIDRSKAELAFTKEVGDVEELCRLGRADEARVALHGLEPPLFPSPTAFRALQTDAYLKPLAEFSRQNPAYFRAFKANEPEAAQEEIAELRTQLAAADAETVTPQSLLMFELLSAVAPANDPVVADWSAVASAADYFDEPDGATLQHWRAAKKALRFQDWPTAVAEMQSITRSTVRTRQPFRAAYGRAILKNQPDNGAEAYPYMLEAAAAGDVEARAWVASEDVAQGRYREGLRWLEARLEDGETAAIPELLRLYSLDPDTLPRDLEREAGYLQRITVAPDAPPLALMLLARLYETGGGTAVSPEKALACYLRAAALRHVPAWVEAARCHLRGLGTAVDLDEARKWAVKAYAAGEREKSAPLLFELMQRAPDRTAAAVLELLEHEQIAAPAGFEDVRQKGTSVSTLRMQVAKYLDQRGSFGAAAKLYAQSGGHDAAAEHRHAELTAVHPCEVCGGTGKVQSSVPCPTCDGKGTVLCALCDGRGYNFVPGSPPCTTCGGSGATVQDGHAVACAACGGTGKGKGSVIKQACTQCVAGRVVCRDCVGGRIKRVKECPECHGVGSRSLADE